MEEKDRRFKKGIAKQRSRGTPDSYQGELNCWGVRLPGFFQSEDKPHQLLGGVGYGDVVMLALSPFFGKVGSKGRVPMADVLGSVVECIAQIPGASFLHVGIAVFDPSGLVGRRRHPRVGQQLVRGIEPGEVTNL